MRGGYVAILVLWTGATALVLAGPGCRRSISSAAMSGRTPAPGASTTAREDVTPVDELADGDVVIEGILKSADTLQVDHDLAHNRIVIDAPAGTIIAGPDPRFLLEIEVTRVSKGIEKDWLGLKHVAIHSLAKSGLSVEPVVGGTWVLHLHASDSDPRQFLHVWAIRSEEAAVAPPPKP